VIVLNRSCYHSRWLICQKELKRDKGSYKVLAQLIPSRRIRLVVSRYALNNLTLFVVELDVRPKELPKH